MKVFTVKLKEGVSYDDYKGTGQILSAVDNPKQPGNYTILAELHQVGWVASNNHAIPEHWQGRRCYNIPKKHFTLVLDPLKVIYE